MQMKIVRMLKTFGIHSILNNVGDLKNVSGINNHSGISNPSTINSLNTLKNLSSVNNLTGNFNILTSLTKLISLNAFNILSSSNNSPSDLENSGRSGGRQHPSHFTFYCLCLPLNQIGINRRLGHGT